MDTRSVLLDIVKHTTGLGIIENIKVAGDDATTLDAIDPDKTVVLSAKMSDNVEDFAGEFGMGNLGLLNSLLKLNDYSGDGVNIEVVRQERDGVEVPTMVVFTNDQGSKDQYRFMSKTIVEQAMGGAIPKFKGASWNVEVQPSSAKVQQLSEVASIYSGLEPTFNVKTENGDLIFEVGSAEGSVFGRRTFAENVGGELASTWSYNLNTALSILKLGMSGTCMISFSDQGVCKIDVDSGVGFYSYIMLAIHK